MWKGERAHLGALVQQLARERVRLRLERVEVEDGRLERVELRAQQGRVLDQRLLVAEPLLIGRLALRERALLQLDLLVQRRQLVVAPDELRAEGVEGER